MPPSRLRHRRRFCAALAAVVAAVHVALLWVLVPAPQVTQPVEPPAVVELRTAQAPPPPAPAQHRPRAPAPAPPSEPPQPSQRVQPLPPPAPRPPSPPSEATGAAPARVGKPEPGPAAAAAEAEAEASVPAPGAVLPVPPAATGDGAESAPAVADAGSSPASAPAPTTYGPRTLSVREVEYQRKPAPVYPLASRRARESGVVVLRVLVDTDGRPKLVEVARSSGYRRLDDAALQAMRKARFKPYLQDGEPREAVVPHLEIGFRWVEE